MSHERERERERKRKRKRNVGPEQEKRKVTDEHRTTFFGHRNAIYSHTDLVCCKRLPEKRKKCSDVFFIFPFQAFVMICRRRRHFDILELDLYLGRMNDIFNVASSRRSCLSGRGEARLVKFSKQRNQEQFDTCHLLCERARFWFRSEKIEKFDGRAPTIVHFGCAVKERRKMLPRYLKPCLAILMP